MAALCHLTRSCRPCRRHALCGICGDGLHLALAADCRWFANWSYDNAQVTVSSCGRLQNGGLPGISVRSALTSDNLGPYTCVKYAAYGCPSSDMAFATTFNVTGNTF